jgi:hypothetical protein
MILKGINNNPSQVVTWGKKWRVFVQLIMVALFAVTIFAAPSLDDKLKPEDLVARHLESIGSAEARAAVKSRAVAGAVTFSSRVGGVGTMNGEGVMLSAGNRFRFNMRFPAVNYPSENMAFDGTRPYTSFMPNGVRSKLSAFLVSQEALLREGFLGGLLSTTWPLARLDQLQPKLEYRGLKKIDGRELQEMQYRPKKGASNLQILLHFDPQTFRHVRTTYKYQVGASIGTRESPEQNAESYYTLTEDFDDFRQVDNFTLPHKYRIQVSVATGTSSTVYDYTLAVSRFSHKEQIDDAVFVLK